MNRFWTITMPLLILISFCVWYFKLSPDNDSPNHILMKQYIASKYTEDELRFRLKEIDDEVSKVVQKNNQIKSDPCLNKDEAYRLKNKCRAGVIRTAPIKFDPLVQKEIIFMGYGCFLAKTVREAKRNGCLPK